MRNVIKRFFRFKGADQGIYLAIFIMSVFGILMVWSAANGSVPRLGPLSAFKKTAQQGLFIVLGAILMTVFAKTFKARSISWGAIVTILGINWAAMLICRVFDPVNGAYAWIKLPGGYTIQPGEFMKISLILGLSFSLSVVHDSFLVHPPFQNAAQKELFEKERFKRVWIFPLAMIMIAFLTGAVINDDLGSSLILALISFVVFMYAPGRFYKRTKKIILMALPGLALLGAFAFKFVLGSYQVKRFTVMLDPLADPTNSAYQLVNSLIAIVNGGLSGLGLDNSTQKFGYIPEAYNDFIGSIVMEEFGLLGLLVILIPITYIIVRMLVYSAKVKSDFERLILIGIATYFFAHVFVNLGGITGLIPMTGVPLLFISYGGSSILCAFMAIGIAQAIIAKYNKEHTSGTKNR